MEHPVMSQFPRMGNNAENGSNHFGEVSGPDDVPGGVQIKVGEVSSTQHSSAGGTKIRKKFVAVAGLLILVSISAGCSTRHVATPVPVPQQAAALGPAPVPAQATIPDPVPVQPPAQAPTPAPAEQQSSSSPASDPSSAQRASLEEDIRVREAELPAAEQEDEANSTWNEDQIKQQAQALQEENDKIAELRQEGRDDEADAEEKKRNLAVLVVGGLDVGTQWEKPTDNAAKLKNQITADQNELNTLN